LNDVRMTLFSTRCSTVYPHCRIAFIL